MGNVPPSALRQPPPPGRRCQLIDSNMEPAPTTSRVRNPPFYSMIESLPVPDDLLMEILVRLSADEIYDNARLVCRRWCHLIHSDAFVQMHLHRASSGLLLKPLFERCAKSSPAFVTTTTQGRVETSLLSGRSNFTVICSCNGLVLCSREDWGSRCRVNPFIFNPATKSAFDLPWCPVTGQRHRVIIRGLPRLGMAYAAASVAYKVVGIYEKSEAVAQCCILTVGVDNEWRDVAIEGLSPEGKFTIRIKTPLMTGGFLHWASETCVVSLNVETEIFTLTPCPALTLPQERKFLRQHRYCCLSAGECLSLFIRCGDWSWEVLEMKPETWEWRKVLPKINIEARKRNIQQFASQKDDFLEPVGWVRYPEVLAFMFNGIGRTCIVYNLDTKEFEFIQLSLPASYHRVVQHTKSLVWSEWC